MTTALRRVLSIVAALSAVATADTIGAAQNQSDTRLAPIVRTEAVGAGVIRIVYDLNGTAGSVFTVALEASNDGGRTFAIRPRATTGDVGSNMTPGTGKTIEWDSTKDVADLQLERYVFRVVVSSVASAGASALKLVSVDGENATNLVRTKTAVTPMVEVRDRSNRPVSGVPVTFAIASGRNITFAGGAATMTVSTDAAGRASATGLTPLSGGAVQISVQAAFQGKRATATIHQLNVITAAPDVPASSGTAAKTGGGMSRGALIGIIAGGAAAGVGVAPRWARDRRRRRTRRPHPIRRHRRPPSERSEEARPVRSR